MVDQAKAEKFMNTISKHKALIHKVSNSYAFTPQDREDLFQDIVLQLWKSFDKYDQRYQFSTWLYRISLNVAISTARKKKRYKRQLEKRPPSTDQFTTGDTEQEKIELLYKYIGRLNEFERALIILYLEERTHQEISDIMGITKTNVATKIGRLKKKLQKQFLQNT